MRFSWPRGIFDTCEFPSIRESTRLTVDFDQSVAETISLWWSRPSCVSSNCLTRSSLVRNSIVGRPQNRRQRGRDRPLERLAAEGVNGTMDADDLQET
ncbi:MAG: hypothetical protein ACI91T_002792, partial [Natronomonas sp.]